MSVDVFFADYWTRRSLYESRSALRGQHLLGSADVEFLAASLIAPQPGWMSLIRDGEDLNLAAVRAPNGHISVKKLRAARESGYTLLLTSLHRRWPAISVFCRHLEGELIQRGIALSHPVVANAYATPKAARGFKPHYDSHEIIIFQLEGYKRWRLFAPVVASPLVAEPVSIDNIGSPTAQFSMSPGDVLYIPRGVPHDASTNEGASLHLTLAIHVHTWLDLALAVMRRMPLFREALQPAIQTSDDAGFSLSDAFRRRLAHMDISEKTVASVAHQFMETFMLGIEGALQVPCSDAASELPLSVDTRVVWERGSFLYFVSHRNDVFLYFPGGKFTGSLTDRDALQYIERHQSFRVGDLPDLTDERKVEIVTALVGCRSLAVDRTSFAPDQSRAD
jgi:hypothetical protein